LGFVVYSFSLSSCLVAQSWAIKVAHVIIEESLTVKEKFTGSFELEV